ncbi:MAG: ATP-dependent helicase [Lachnospiraceae bacterium]|nr:ATP-dependent helicase [Lachnospiraceae bacterium]
MAVENPEAYGTGLSALSPAQADAVTHSSGPCQVIAGPGSGKTFVITYRLHHLISSLDIDPSNILTITFTKAAAEEMSSRAHRLLSDRAGALTIGTFHSVFYKILRHTYRFSSENIIQFQTQHAIISEILESLEAELTDRGRGIPGLISEISRMKCSLKENAELESAFLSDDEFGELFRLYKKRMNDMRLIDFDDMMLLSLDLFRERPETLKRWQDKFCYIQVDEFQDVDMVQYELLKLLAGEERNLFVVGDDDQSIYGFRGSDPGIMLHFKEDFPSARMVKLSVNYRSVPEIVDAAGIVVSENTLRIEKDIVSGSEELNGKLSDWEEENSVDIREFKDREEEISEFKGLISGPGARSTAVLLRTNELLSYFAEMLSSLSIPFSCRDRIRNIYDHFIAEDILSYLAIASGNMRRSLFFRIMNRPFRGISRNAVQGERVDFREILAFHSSDVRTVCAVRRLENDLKLLSKMKPYVAVHYILKGMGYEKFIKDYAADRKLNSEELLRTAEEIKLRAKSFRSYAVWNDAISEYRRELERIKDQGNKTDTEREGLCLMTMHASKGLEFDEVFLFDVNEGIVPYHKAMLPSEIEEERRLLYVAMTRAKRRLHIWYIRDNAGKHMEVSRFLKGLL